YALRDAAVDLPFHDHGIDHGAEIIDGRPVDDFGLARVAVDLDLTDVASGRKGEIRRVVEACFLQPGFELLARELMRDVGIEGYITPRRRFVSARNRELSVFKFDIALRRFQHMSSDFLGLYFDLVERLGHR